MSGLLLVLDKTSDQSLQFQIRERIVDGILSNTIPAGTRLPSSRKLSQTLKVSRNTVTLAFESLVDEGYLLTRDRSGFYVNDELSRIGVFGRSRPSTSVSNVSQNNYKEATERKASSMPYPFIDGLQDPDLVPLAEWRECHRLAMATTEMRDWSTLGSSGIDQALVDEIRSKVLTTKGIFASQSEILITNGMRAGLNLLASHALPSGHTLGLLEPCEPVVRQIIETSIPDYQTCRTDEENCLLENNNGNHVVCLNLAPQVFPGHQNSEKARAELIKNITENNVQVWECDRLDAYPSDQPISAAIRSLPGQENSFYLGSLNSTVTAGQAVGFLVGPADKIRNLRKHAERIGCIPPSYTQRVLAKFLALGYYNAALRRLSLAYDKRWEEMSQALMFHMGGCFIRRFKGVPTFWIEAATGIDVKALSRQAEKQGILIEPGSSFVRNASEKEKRSFQLSIAAVGETLIEKGIADLGKIKRNQLSKHVEKLSETIGELLTEETLFSRLDNMHFFGINPLGERFEVVLKPDGTMLGVVNKDSDKEEQDTGRWWIENGMWHRHWGRWSYGREARFYVVIQDHVIKWFKENGDLIDHGVILSSNI